jgi:hypothetical protein
MTIDLDRITHPLRLASGSHEAGSGKGCAMNVISYINGDTYITDYPECSARPLARLVQSLNDILAGPDGFLSPENSVLVLDLGWLTVGTADVPREVMLRWFSELLVDPQWGVVQFARPDSVGAIRCVAKLLVRDANGRRVSCEEWEAAANSAYAASANAANAANAAYAAYASANAANAAYASANAANAAYASAASANAANAADAAANAANAAYAAANAAANAAYANADFTRWAITRWRDLAGLDSPENVAAESVDYALSRIG